MSTVALETIKADKSSAYLGFVVPEIMMARLFKSNPVLNLSEAEAIRDKAMAEWIYWEKAYKEVIAKAAGVETRELTPDPTETSVHFLTYDHLMTGPEECWLGTYPAVEFPPLMHHKFGLPWFSIGSAIAVCTEPDKSTQTWSWMYPLADPDGQKHYARRCIPSSELRETANLYRKIAQATSSFLSEKIRGIISEIAPRKIIFNGNLEILTIGVRDGPVVTQKFTPVTNPPGGAM